MAASAALGMEMLEQSLHSTATDHLDLWQIHGVAFDNDPELAYRKGGVLEALDKAKQQGKTRFVGFTGHKDPHDPSADDPDGLSVRCCANAAQRLRRLVPQLRANRFAGSESPRHRRARA